MYSHKKITSILLSISITVSTISPLIFTDSVGAMVAISNGVDNTYDAPIVGSSTESNLVLGNYFDTIALAGLTNTLTAGNGDSSRYTSVYGSDGDDVITLGNNWQHIDIKNGVDTLSVGSGKLSTFNDIVAGDGNKTITVGNNYCQIAAGKNDNKITTGNISNCYGKITSGNGNNTITVGNGYSEIGLGNGNNTITGLNGTTGYDSVNIAGGNNDIQLGNSWDYIYIGNTSSNSTGTNNIHLGDMPTSEGTIALGNQDNTIVAGKNYNTITVGNGNNNITVGDSSVSTWNTITTGDGNNVFNIGNYFDRISLGKGNNSGIIKGYGNSIYCGAGDNKMYLPSNYSQYKFSFGYNNDFIVTNTAGLTNTFYNCNKLYFNDKSLSLNYSSKTSSSAAYNINGSCGSANSTEVTTAPNANLCGDGSTPTVTITSTGFAWSCAGSIAGTTASCSATKILPITGSCGTSAGASLLTAPTTNLCLTGTPSNVTTTATGFSWSCAGNSIGNTVSCSATLQTTNTNSGTTSGTGSSSTNSGTTSTGTTTDPETVNTDPVVTSTGITWESEYLSSNVGYVVNDPNASGKKAKFASKGTAGFMQFGPYTDLITHNEYHTAVFRLKITDNTFTGVVAVIDINNFNGTGNRVLKYIRGTDFKENNIYEDFNLDFYRTDDGKIEFRVNTTGAGDIYADKVSVIPYDNTSIQTTTWESEELMTSVGNVIADSSASKGFALAAKVGVNKAGTLQFGPYNNTLMNGKKYTAKFWIKTIANTSSVPIGMIDIYDSKTGYRKSLEFKATDFNSVNTYQEFDIDFIKPTSDNIEFRVFFYGIQDIYADKVEVVGASESMSSVYESEKLYGITSSIITDAEAVGGLARESKVGRDAAGTAQFGPYSSANLIDGNTYNAIFRIKTPSITSNDYIGLIDVFDLKSGFRKIKELKASDFSAANTYQEFTISFEKPSNSSLEYRLMFYGVQDLTIDNVRVENGESIGLPTYESEELPSRVGKIVSDSNASNGRAIFFDKNLFSPHWMQFGPYNVDGVKVDASYNANFVLKTDDNTNTGVIAYINVYNSGKGINILVPIKGTDFKDDGIYQTFTMPFKMVDNTMMEFRVFPTGLSNLYADKVYLTQ